MTMSKRKHSPGPVPPGNRPKQGGGADETESQEQSERDRANQTDTFQEQDPQRRLGDFNSEGEHSLQEPSRLNDGNTHSE
jgi:hypothetical protein